MSQKWQNCCFTAWAEPHLGEDERVVFWCYGEEICPKTGKLHYQGVLQLKNAYGLSGIKKIIGDPTAHVENMKGTIEQAYEYCIKDGKAKQGGTMRSRKKNLTGNVKTIVANGGTMRDVVEHSTCGAHINYGLKLLTYMEKKRNEAPTVYWYWGRTGTGKTKAAEEEAGPNAYWTGSNLKWWDGYDGHENVIIDDFRDSMLEFALLLRLLDRYPYTIEVKGGTRQFLAKNIWITCSKKPENCYTMSPEDKAQLLRRITKVREFGQKQQRQDGNLGNTVLDCMVSAALMEL